MTFCKSSSSIFNILIILISLHLQNICCLLVAPNAVAGSLKLKRSLQFSLRDRKNSPQSGESSQSPYLKKEDRPYLIGSKPASAAGLAGSNFRKEVFGLLSEATSGLIDNISSEKTREKRQKVLPDSLGLRLSNEMVIEAETSRIAAGGGVDAHPISLGLYKLGCFFLDSLFDGRPLERFWFLETVARIPYFSYVSMLHLYETFGWWREPSLRKIHNAEEWNELHHLLIMETLGADRRWSVRFLGFHCAFLYYWLLIATYLYSPTVAYQFMELLEAHAVDTYGTFVIENEEALKLLPAPDVAVKYYAGSDLYDFDEFQASRPAGSRRPPCATLMDVFVNIRDDEAEHVKTMQACQKYASQGETILSPHDFGSWLGMKGSVNEAQRTEWREWAAAVNSDGKKANRVDADNDETSK